MHQITIRMREQDWQCLRASAYDNETSVSGRALQFVKEKLQEEGRFDDQEEKAPPRTHAGDQVLPE
jgi:hypothetical protein